MPRSPRILLAHQPHHIVQRGHRQEAVFRIPSDYRAYLSDLYQQTSALGVAVHAWCLMPNHVHLLLTPGDDPRTISRVLQYLARRATVRWNARRRTTGSLWEARFKSRVVDEERYLLECCRYIELNPVRAGLTRTPDGYPWSSCRERMGMAASRLLAFHPLYLAMGNSDEARRKAYHFFLTEYEKPRRSDIHQRGRAQHCDIDARRPGSRYEGVRHPWGV